MSHQIIVAGGAGFLGSNLVDKLIDQGDKVICLDNLITGNLDNIKHLQNNSNFKFLEIDITKELPQDLQADQIYHLASPASPNSSNPKSYHALAFETMKVNSNGTWALAELAIKLRAKFLFASTSEVYGDPKEHPQREDYRGNVSTTGPRSVYDEAKRFGETIVSAFIRSMGLNGRIVRIFNTYGPRMPQDGRAVSEFVTACLKNQPIQVFGDGEQTRSFCYSSDLIEGLVLAMNSQDTQNQVFNLGNPSEFTIKELAEKIKSLTGASSEIVYSQTLPEDDPLKRQPDIEKAKSLLHWEPKINLETGLTKYIDYLKLAR